MKKTEKNGENSSSSQEKKRFGLQLGEEGVSSSIIGGIVEKGFSAPVSQPQVKVLPFSVARHRSHGPHWAPRTGNLSTHDNNEEDDGEDEDHTNFNLLAANAKPIQRKQKKDLNFKQWKELTNDDNTTKKQHKYNGNPKPSDPKNTSSNTNSEVTNIHKQKASNVGMNDAQSKYENGTQSTIKSNNISEKVMVESKDEIMVDLNMEKSHKSTSMESEIDAENRARLEKMSSDEIAEAQGEIMKKMNPALIKILQKRGQEKMSKKSSSSIGQTVDRKEQKEKESIKNEQKSIKTNSNHSKSGLESEKVSENKSNSSSLWDAWSTNVETSRDLRFSLDGDVIDDYGHVPGKTSAENAAERDFLRTEGDPGAIGYTIKEALALTRSVVPGQRALALHLLASVLYKAQENICKNQLGSTLKIGQQNKIVDWEALWAFALGPEPELALSLRMCLDDNHNSVVIACARVIQCVLSFDFNEHFFDISEKTGVYEKDIYTAPIFRNRPKIDVGFLHGGFWKYSTKPSNIFPFEKVMGDNGTEEEHTIKDDIVVATQDILAGLVRMGILPRIRYLLESDPSAALEETLISILVAIARHSPNCADAIMKCERLVQVIVYRFTTRDTMGVDFSKIKSVTLMKVLARSGRCKEFIDNGTFQKLTWHLYRSAFGIDDLLNKETEKVKLWSTLLIEQLRFWKVCLQYNYCASYFSNMFPALFIWLDIPSFKKLRGKNVISEFLSVTNEAYLVLEALTRTLPNFYSKNIDQKGTWSWSNVGPMIDLALKWVSVKSDPDSFTVLSLENELTSMLWVISAVFNMILGVLKSVLPEDDSRKLPWLPDFVPKIGLHIIKNSLLRFNEVNKDLFLDFLSQCRNGTNQETKLASVCCLNGLINVVVLIDNLIKLNNNEIKTESTTMADKILTNGILECCKSELTTFMKLLTSSSSQLTKSIEMFGRGGPAPGVGVGWGASGGGFWSETILVAQMDARLVLQLVEIFLKNPKIEDINATMERISLIFDLVLLVGPRDRGIMDKSLDILLQPSLLKFLDFGIRHLKTFEWKYTEEEYITFSENLISHYKNRWLNTKKSKSKLKSPKKTKFSLDTIQEDVDQTIQSTLVTEWAHQRLPLPNHWFLSSISTFDLVNLPVKPTFPEVSRSGLFFLLSLESLSTHVSPNSIEGVPVIWKLHALSVTLFAGLDILEEEKTKDVYSTLQEIYGKILDKKISEIGSDNSVDFLKFDQEIHDSYSTFVETLVENFAGASYGNLIYARQISMYLNRCVGGQIRLATWNALSNIRALELLPPLEKCLGHEEGYLEPPEGEEMILEAYVKSWVSGALDKSVTRNSVAFTLVIHHLSCFIFGDDVGDKVSLRNKLAKSILRDYSRKSDHEGMMVKLIQYKKPATYQKVDGPEIARRLTLLREACEGNSTLLSIVEKLKNVVL